MITRTARSRITLRITHLASRVYGRRFIGITHTSVSCRRAWFGPLITTVSASAKCVPSCSAAGTRSTTCERYD